MEIGSAILRGVRLGAIVFAVGLVGLTVYRVLDVEDDDDVSASSAKSPAVASAAGKPAKVSGGEKFYPPPPPPLPGRAAVAKPVRTGRDVMVVDVPAARETLVADASTTLIDAPPDFAVQGPAVPVPEMVVPTPPAPPRSNRFIRSVRKIFHITK